MGRNQNMCGKSNIKRKTSPKRTSQLFRLQMCIRDSLSDICPFTLGTAIYPDGLKDAIMSPLIERNSVLPCSRESLYTTIHLSLIHIYHTGINHGISKVLS